RLPSCRRATSRCGRKSRRRAWLCAYCRLRDRRRRAGDERRGRLVERPQCQGQLEGRAGQRRDRTGQSNEDAARRRRRAARPRAERSAVTCDDPQQSPFLCAAMVRVRGNCARHLWTSRRRSAEDRASRQTMMQMTTLANGLRVASRPMTSVETVAVGLYAPTGSRHEEGRINGIAHLFEHMVFKGAGGRSARQISETVEDVGGDLNASTDRELTAFYASLLAP